MTGTLPILAACSVLLSGCLHPRPADLVLLNGNLVTIDDERPRAEALAIAGDTIVAVGGDDEIRAFIGASTTVLDLGGRLALPGFIDAHGHFLSLGQARMKLDLTTARNWDEVVRMVGEEVRRAPAGSWILGRGWHQEKWDRPPSPATGGLPVHEALSRITPDNPVVLTHASGHALIANTAAMAAAGITADTPDPPGGEILKDRTGAPTGVFRETAADLLFTAFAASQDTRTSGQLLADRLRAVELATRECLSKGVTSFQDAGSSFDSIDFFRDQAERGKLGVRLWVMIAEDNPALAERLLRYRILGAGDHMLTVRAIKRLIDGALGSHGAWLLQPYQDLPGSTGLCATEPGIIAETAELAIRHGFQLCTHAIGDRANREILDVYEAAFRRHPDKTDLRWRVEHAQHLHPDDIGRFASLSVVASMQGIHCTSDGPWVPKRLGEERAAIGAYVWRKLLDSGAVVANGTDTPVEDVDPIANYHALVTRRMTGGTAFHPEQRMTREEALRACTLDAAFAAFEEDIKGSLTPGKLADMVVLSRDILTVPEEHIPGTEVLTTILGGKVVYRNPAFDEYEQVSSSLEGFRRCAPAEVEAALDSFEYARELQLRGHIGPAADTLELARSLVRRVTVGCLLKRMTDVPAAPPPGEDSAATGGPTPGAPTELDLRANLVFTQLKLADACASRGDQDNARLAYLETVRVFRHHKLPAGSPAAEAAAKAAFQLAELDLAAYEALRFDVQPTRLTRALNHKAAALKRLEGRYSAIRDFGSRHWTLAAFFRVGYLYENFVDSLTSASCQPDLSGGECERLRAKLAGWAINPRKKAIAAYTAMLSHARRLDMSNEWTVQADERLRRMKAEQPAP